MGPTTKEQAEESLARQSAAGREIAAAYRRLFATRDGQVVLGDLRARFDPAAARFPASFTKGNPLAAFFGGIHYDGSAVVLNHIAAQMAAVAEPAPPNIITS
jgi:hypothetical protein